MKRLAKASIIATACLFLLGGVAYAISNFVNTDGNKTVIEVFGDYWHKGEDPQERINLFKQYGFKTLVFWESHIYEKSIDELASEIKAFN